MAIPIFDSSVHTLQAMAVLICATTALSMVLTRLLIVWLPKWGMVDKPDFKRHIHTKTVPRGGGLGMLVAFVTISAIFFSLTCRGGDATSQKMLKLLAPLAILLPLGVLDDRRGLRARTKFLFQTLAALVAWLLGFRMEVCFGIHFPVWLGLPLTLFWIVAFINAFNMIDGVDGLAAGVGIISAFCLGTTALTLRHYQLASLLAVFAASLLGFLYFNWHPARLFMGDTGSMFIGYLLAVAGLCINAQTISVVSIGIPLLACGIPVIDICLAIWRRVFRPSAPSSDVQDTADAKPSFLKRLAYLAARLGTADQSHIHHRLLRHFQNNQRKTIYSIYALAFGMGLVGVACCYLPNNNLLLALVIVLGTFSFILNRLAFIELWNTTEALYGNFQSAHAGILISYVINPIWDLSCIVMAYFIAKRNMPISMGCLLRYVAILMVVLCCSRSYRVFWNFAVADDYFRLGYTLIFGFLIARCSDFLFHYKHIDRLHSYAAGIAVALIILERLFIHYFRNTQIRRHVKSQTDDGKLVLSAIIGITPIARLYRNQLATDLEHAGRERIVGLVAQDHHFVHSYCYGMQVLGRLDSLEYIIEHNKIGKIILTQDLPETETQFVQDTCRKMNVALTTFDCQETTM